MRRSRVTTPRVATLANREDVEEAYARPEAAGPEWARPTPRARGRAMLRARLILGWEPEVELEEGLRRTIEYYRSLNGG